VLMEDVDQYLWEVYQRSPIKKDNAGDFTWKDPAAAKRVNMSLPDYVIGGMDPDFREQLYHAGRAMDAAGLKWTMLSAFRDDYRQRLASGFKARTGNSLHGGSRATGGLNVVTHVDVVPPRKDDAVALLKALGDASRKDEGSLRYEVVQQTNRPNHFTVIESWKSREAFEAHGMAPHVREFRDKLAPMSGALYDERLYEGLI